MANLLAQTYGAIGAGASSTTIEGTADEQPLSTLANVATGISSYTFFCWSFCTLINFILGQSTTRH